MSVAETEKLQKVLARAGLGSRRQIENWIAAGRIEVNRRQAVLGDRVTLADDIRLDGRRIGLQHTLPARRVLCYHKPAGEICSRHDPEGRPTVFERLPRLRQGRWISVGRLDLNTAGLLLLTDDGELANRLMHPKYAVEREYAVRVLGEVTPTMLQLLRQGILLDDGMARFEQITEAGGEGANHWYHVVLHEGRHREVRRLWESQGITVSRLIRVRYGPVRLPPGLPMGHCVDLDKAGTSLLLKLVGLPEASATPVDKPDKLTNNRRSPANNRRSRFRR